MEQIIQVLDSVGPDFKYFVLGIGIVITITLIVIVYTKWESRRATSAYKKKKKK